MGQVSNPTLLAEEMMAKNLSLILLSTPFPNNANRLQLLGSVADGTTLNAAISTRRDSNGLGIMRTPAYTVASLPYSNFGILQGGHFTGERIGSQLIGNVAIPASPYKFCHKDGTCSELELSCSLINKVNARVNGTTKIEIPPICQALEALDASGGSARQ